VQQDQVDVIFGGIYSSTRQAIKGPAVVEGRKRSEGPVSTSASAITFAMHYNFCRIHQSLRVTHAIESGVTDHVESPEESGAVAPTSHGHHGNRRNAGRDAHRDLPHPGDLLRRRTFRGSPPVNAHDTVRAGAN
jgi:hypothetical protein